MAILAIPFASVYLVPHVSGGAILHAGGGYVASAFVPAYVVEAFGVASGVLSQLAGSAGAIASGTASLAANPVVIGGAIIAATALGAYCYFHGIPAPIEAALSSAGVGAATKHGFAISAPKLAVALILLGGSGYLAFKFYRGLRSLRAARLVGTKQKLQSREAAATLSRDVFGEGAWSQFGAAIWASAEAVGRGALKGAQDAGRQARDAATYAAQKASELAEAVNEAGSSVFQTAAAVGAGFSAESYPKGWMLRIAAIFRKR